MPISGRPTELYDASGDVLVGQKAMAASVPVTLSSDQSAIPITVIPAGATTGLSVGRITLGGGTVNSLNAIRATPYTEQAANAQRSLASSNASDTAAGIGARKVTITYYDVTGAGPFTEEVTLNGVTAVATVAVNICFIEKMVVTSVGSGLSNVGTITLFVNSVGGGGTIGTIGLSSLGPTAGDNQTFWAHHYVPVGKTASLVTLVVGSSGGSGAPSALFFLRSKNTVTANAPEIQVSDLIRASITSVVRVLGVPIKVVGPARIVAYGVPDQNGAGMSASFDYSEVST